MQPRHRLLVSLTALALVGGGALALPSEGRAANPAREAPAAGSVPTAAAVRGVDGLEARKVARAAVPRIRWRSCRSPVFRGLGREAARLQCATIHVPLDYDQPHGARTPLQLTRLRAASPGRRIGSLFVNPGGPGGSAGGFVPYAGTLLGEQVDARFDVVGVDPRGTGGSGRTTCRGPVRLPGGYVEFPRTAKQVRQTIAFDNGVRRACQKNGTPLVDHASTADVARDMDLVRRALHEKKLTYYGISYGSYLGQVYAAMFPGHVRALVVDGVLDPVAWSTGPTRPSGSSRGPLRPFSYRLHSGRGAYEALTAAFNECDRVGQPRCALAPGALTKWTTVLEAADEGRLTDEGQRVTYQNIVGLALGVLYDHSSVPFIAAFVADLYEGLTASTRGAATVDVSHARHYDDLVAARDDLEARGLYASPALRGVRTINVDVVFPAVACSDGRNPENPRAWEAASKVADKREPWFGRLWTWASSPCARLGVGSPADAYHGPWRSTRTSYPLLIVGNSHDPATPVSGARRANTLFEKSVFVLYDSWGHGALGGSPCISNVMADYLVGRDLPPDGTVCKPSRPLYPQDGFS